MMSRGCNIMFEAVIVITFCCLLIPYHCNDDPVIQSDIDKESESETSLPDDTEPREPTIKPSSAEKYKLRLSQYRGLQAQVMQSVFKKVEKKDLSGLLSTMLTSLFKIMLEARANLTKVGYVAGDDFPEDTETIESLSKVFENAFMFSDLLLQRPKAIHGIYDEHQDWQDSLKWAYQVCFKSGVFSGQEQEYLDLMAKEAGVLPKDANFVNPYLDESEKPRKRFEEPVPVEKKKPKKSKRGPRLSHTEL